METTSKEFRERLERLNLGDKSNLNSINTITGTGNHSEGFGINRNYNGCRISSSTTPRYENWEAIHAHPNGGSTGAEFRPPPPLPPRPRPASASATPTQIQAQTWGQGASSAAATAASYQLSWRPPSYDYEFDHSRSQASASKKPPPPPRPPPPQKSTLSTSTSLPQRQREPHGGWNRDRDGSWDRNYRDQYNSHDQDNYDSSLSKRGRERDSDDSSRPRSSFGGSSYVISDAMKKLWNKAKEQDAKYTKKDKAVGAHGREREPGKQSDEHERPFRFGSSVNLGRVHAPTKAPATAAAVWVPAVFGTCLKCQDFSAVDAHAARFPRHSVHSLSALAADLTAPFQSIGGASVLKKARAIFIWLHHNIQYDTVSFFANDLRHKTPEQTLRSGLAVCQGYAELFTELGHHAGFESIVISGHGKGFGYSRDPTAKFESNHAWNAVRLDGDGGGWHLIDCCWGAGHLDSGGQYNRKLATEWFTSTPEAFRRRHFPTDAHHQFCSPPSTWAEYSSQPEPPNTCSDVFDKYGFSVESISPPQKFLPASTTTATFIIRTKCEHAAIPPADQHVLLLSVGEGNQRKTPFEVDRSGTEWKNHVGGGGASSLMPGCKVSAWVVTKLGGKDGRGISVAEYKRTEGRVGWSLDWLCSWEVENY